LSELASIASAVYVLPEMPNEPGPTPKLLLVVGHWEQNSSVCFSTNPIECSESGPVWRVEYMEFDSIADVGEYIIDRYWPDWQGREILGLWELTESNRIPIKHHQTTKTIEKHIEVEEYEQTTDHYQVGEEEFSGDPH